MENDQKTGQQASEGNSTTRPQVKGQEDQGTEQVNIILRRRLQAITAATRAVLRGTGEIPMLKDVCRIIIELGGYRLAWVGYAENDSRQTVRPMAHKGFEDGYLDTVNITWADTERGQGPTGRAIRTGKTVIARNILDFPGYEPWRQQARQRGFAASIAVPLTFAGTCLGALNVYAVEPRAFDRDEARLMEELAQDLAYGISTRREQALREKMGDALKKSEERLFSIYNTVGDGIFHLQAETAGQYRFVSVNQSFCRITGWHQEQVVGRTVAEIIREPSLTTAADNCRQAIETKTVVKWEDVFACPAGRREGEVSVAPAFDHRGQCTHLIGSLHDITERKLAERQRARLEAQNRQLQKAESLGRMAGSIAHYFNNRLGVVIGNLDLILRDLPPDAKTAANLKAALLAAEKAAEMSSLMLTYLGHLPDRRDPVDLSAATRSVLAVLQAGLPENVLLVANLADPGPVIKANARQIEQILQNLVINAREAVGEGEGKINLTVKAASRAAIPAAHRFPVNWQPQDTTDYACLEVTDTGCGITEKDIEKLCDPFYSSKVIGRGLGLAVVMGIVRAHGGVITVESEPGRGSTFRVFFPVVAG